MTTLRAEEFLPSTRVVAISRGKIISPHANWKGDKDNKAVRPRKKPTVPRKPRAGATGAAAAVREAVTWFSKKAATFTSNDVAARTGVPAKTASNYLAHLRTEGVLEVVHKLPSPTGGRPVSAYCLKPGAQV